MKRLVHPKRLCCFGQTYKSSEPSIRKLFSNIFLNKVSKHELNLIMDEIIEGHKNDIDAIIKLVFDN
jgi:hypothetical protein